MYNYRDIDENKSFSNGGLNLHIARIVQRCQWHHSNSQRAHLRDIETAKKTLYGLQCTLIGPWHRTTIELNVLPQGPNVTRSRRLVDPVGNVVQVFARCNTFLNALIYMSQYDVVKAALVGFARKAAAKLSWQQQNTATN